MSQVQHWDQQCWSGMSSGTYCRAGGGWWGARATSSKQLQLYVVEVILDWSIPWVSYLFLQYMLLLVCEKLKSDMYYRIHIWPLPCTPTLFTRWMLFKQMAALCQILMGRELVELSALSSCTWQNHWVSTSQLLGSREQVLSQLLMRPHLFLM